MCVGLADDRSGWCVFIAEFGRACVSMSVQSAFVSVQKVLSSLTLTLQRLSAFQFHRVT